MGQKKKTLSFSYAEEDGTAPAGITLSEVEPMADIAIGAGLLDAGEADL